MAEFSEMVNNFSTDIYQTLIADNKDKNIILSPLSIQTALALTFMGAKGLTSDAMAKVLRLSNTDRRVVAKHFQSFMETLNDNASVKLANKVYVQENYTIKKEFNDLAAKHFYSEAQHVDFKNAQAAASSINEWVELKTNKKIQDLVKPDMFDALTRMVLVNAIYFKGLWTHPFKKESTVPAPFWLNAKDKIDVDMMHNKAKYNYGVFDDLDATGLEMTYKDSNISMFIILPNKRDGLAELEEKLKGVNLNELTQNMWNQEVNVSLPKFKVEFELSLVDTLKKMGMGICFDDSADFSDLLDSTEPLCIADVIHKAFIEVNEEGAEAAAATACHVQGRCLNMSEYFEVHHPFLYTLQDTDKSVILFTGHVTDIPASVIDE